MYLVGGVLVPLAQMLPPVGTVGIWIRCENTHQENAECLISALEEYHDDYGRYPKEVEDLVPEYIAELPSAPCIGHYGMLLGKPGKPDYYLYECSREEVTLLVVPSFHGVGVQRHNLATGEWSGIDPWSDDMCGYLEQRSGR